MTAPSSKMKKAINKILDRNNLEKLEGRMISVSPEQRELLPLIPGPRNWSKEAQAKRLEIIKNVLNRETPFISGEKKFENPEELKGNIENYIGMTQVPTGLIGPLRIIGAEANGDFYVPMATSEGALIASYNRGARIVSLSGGARTICLVEGVQRTPSFEFNSFIEAGKFLLWIMKNMNNFKRIAGKCTSHGKLEDVKSNIVGNLITLIFEYTTGDASGQNMVTICTDAVCKYIISKSPVKPKNWYIEGNLSGDKKASSVSFNSVRGKKVLAEVEIKKELIKNILHTTAEGMLNYWKVAMVNGIQTGSIGVNGHFANGLAGIFLACGQDVATIAEASVGNTKVDVLDNGDLYISVTLPNLIAGTVGGGTKLPTQRECLELMDCYGNGRARKFAEICAATVLCGEISISGAIVAGDFTKAHMLFGRKK